MAVNAHTTREQVLLEMVSKEFSYFVQLLTQEEFNALSPAAQVQIVQIEKLLASKK